MKRKFIKTTQCKSLGCQTREDFGFCLSIIAATRLRFSLRFDFCDFLLHPRISSEFRNHCRLHHLILPIDFPLSVFICSCMTIRSSSAPLLQSDFFVFRQKKMKSCSSERIGVRQYNKSELPRLRWTPELHRYFVQTVEILGGRNRKFYLVKLFGSFRVLWTGSRNHERERVRARASLFESLICFFLKSDLLQKQRRKESCK